MRKKNYILSQSTRKTSNNDNPTIFTPNQNKKVSISYNKNDLKETYRNPLDIMIKKPSSEKLIFSQLSSDDEGEEDNCSKSNLDLDNSPLLLSSDIMRFTDESTRSIKIPSLRKKKFIQELNLKQNFMNLANK